MRYARRNASAELGSAQESKRILRISAMNDQNNPRAADIDNVIRELRTAVQRFLSGSDAAVLDTGGVKWMDELLQETAERVVLGLVHRARAIAAVEALLRTAAAHGRHHLNAAVLFNALGRLWASGDYTLPPRSREAEHRSSSVRRGKMVPSPGAIDTPVSVEMHFLADMAAEVAVNTTVTIEVSIARDALIAIDGRATGEATGMVDPTMRLLVQVAPRRNFVLAEAVQERQELDPPESGDRKLVYFEVKAAHEGPGEIWIIVRQRQMGIARLVLTPKVVASAHPPTPRASVSGTAVSAPPLRAQLNQLLIIEQTIGNTVQYLFELEMPSLNVFGLHSSTPLKARRDDYVRKLYAEIEDRYISNYNADTRKADVTAFTTALQAYGATLFEELFPHTLRELLWTHRDQINGIRVVSTEPFIPWEIVHLREPGKPIAYGSPSRFLGQMGLTRWLHNVDGLPPLALTVRGGRAKYVIPEYADPQWKLPATLKERHYLEKTFDAEAIEPQPDSVMRVLTEPGAADLLHFACHGIAESDSIMHARILLQGRAEGNDVVTTHIDAATVDTFAQFRSLDGVQPIVFLNACQAGRAGYKLTGIGGFAQAFLRAGAGVFVGTLWSVGDEPAFSFGKEFYDNLRNGKTISESTIAAREASRNAGDATWLAYVVYGHPHATLR
jgi:hypothetical protein